MPKGAIWLVQLLHGPQRPGSRVGFLVPAYFAFDVRVLTIGQAHITLKPWPVFAQVVPQARQIGPALCGVGGIKRLGKLRSQRCNRPQVIYQQMPA